MKIEFFFDKERDLKNIWRTCQKSDSYGYDFTKTVSKSILEVCQGKEFGKCKSDLKKQVVWVHKSPLIEDIVKLRNSSWSKIEKEYFKRLERITKHKFSLKKLIPVFMTSVQKCPYNADPKTASFYVNIFGNSFGAMQTCGHELMHIHLHNSPWWPSTEKEIGYEKTNNLKEALTELLNLEFRDLWVVKDVGYPNHQELRIYIHKQWLKDKNFKRLTTKCIKWIKKNGIK